MVRVKIADVLGTRLSIALGTSMLGVLVDVVVWCIASDHLSVSNNKFSIYNSQATLSNT
jgi:hypothetical protein